MELQKIEAGNPPAEVSGRETRPRDADQLIDQIVTAARALEPVEERTMHVTEPGRD
jgi:hypothetical protein